MVTRRSAKDRGSKAERSSADYLKANGFPYADRRVKTGSKDKGDIGGVDGWTFEVKAAKTYCIPAWLKEADVEADNAGTINRAVIIKPNGVGFDNVADWWAVMPFWNLVDLIRPEQ